MKRIYLLPNLITTANLVCGFAAMTLAYGGQFKRAIWFIVIAAICDSLDGRIARMAKATSPFGVQFDSLSDLTSFGVAPAFLMFAYGLKNVPEWGFALATAYAVCAALRLARFNVQADEADHESLKRVRKGYFQGLPSPASAGLVVATFMAQETYQLLSQDQLNIFLAILSPLLGGLMVSSIPFPSFKEINWRARTKAIFLLIPIALFLFAIEHPELTIVAIAYSYLVMSLLWAARLAVKKKPESESTLTTDFDSDSPSEVNRVR